jgi:hypothetical protein
MTRIAVPLPDAMPPTPPPSGPLPPAPPPSGALPPALPPSGPLPPVPTPTGASLFVDEAQPAAATASTANQASSVFG